MLSSTVSDGRLSLLSRPYSPTRFLIACVQEARPVCSHCTPAPCGSTSRTRSDATENKAHTASYRYVLQAADAHDSWLVRWEYLRDPPSGYPYALGHVHVRAEFAAAPIAGPAAKALSRLHLPTARVALELVLRHVIAEWGVTAKTDAWPQILDESLAGFEERRSAP